MPLLLLLIAVLALHVPSPSAARAAGAPVVTAPKAGRYTGTAGPRRDLSLYVTGRPTQRSISIVAFKFGCGRVFGRTSLTDIKLTKVTLGYRLNIRAHGIVTYLDGHPDENAKIDIRGRFRPNGKSVAGYLRVRAPHCKDTHNERWTARRP